MPATAPAERTRRDPLGAHEVQRTVELLQSATRALQTCMAGRAVTGSDAALVRELCHRLGQVLAAVGREAES